MTGTPRSTLGRKRPFATFHHPADSSKLCASAGHFARETVLRDGRHAPDEQEEPAGPDAWLHRSLAGDESDRQRMFVWVHECGRRYYLEKTAVEPLLSYHDAQDLATEALIEFEKSWRRVRSVEHYTRRMLKNNLQRFLKRKRRCLKRESILAPEQIEYHASEAVIHTPEFGFERFSDEDLRRVHTASDALEQADPIVQLLFRYRVFSESMTYREISEIVGATETSLRMRMARFNRRVRELHRRQELNRASQTSSL